MAGEIDTAALLNEAATAQPEQALAEAQPQNAAPTEAPQQAAAQVNVLNPAGKLVSIPSSQLSDALNAGYQQATDQHVHDYVMEQKYGSAGQQAITGLEGAAKAATFGLSSGLERALGVKPEDIEGRAETNPGTHMVGEGAGLIASSLIPGVGAAHLLEAAGTKAAQIAGLGAAESLAGKIGSAAVKGFVENSLYQSGDEFSKLALGNPNSVQTAAADIGLSGLLGGVLMGGGTAAVGGTKALWEATAGKQTNGFLNALVRRMGGIEGQVPDDVKDALKVAGVEITPAMRAAHSEIPFVKQQGKILLDATTPSGLKFAADREAYRVGLQDVATRAVDKTPEQLTKLEDLSEKQIGESIKDSLITKLKSTAEPIEQSYGKISDKFKNTVIPANLRADMSDALGRVLDNGVSAESAEAKLLNRVIAETSNPKLATLEQLRNYASGIRNETSGIAKQELWNISGKIKRVLDDFQEKTLTQVVEKEAPDLIAEHSATKSAYKGLKDLIGDLNDRLHTGRNAGPRTFIRNLEEMDGEAVLRRLSPKGKAGLIGELSTNFPEVAEAVKGFERDKIIKKAISPEGLIDPNKLDKQIQAISPEMRQFLFKPEQLEKLAAAKTLLDHIPTKEGLSGTPKGLDGLMSNTPAAAAAAVTGLVTGSPQMAALAFAATKFLGRDLPDATRLGLLKFLGSSSEVSAPGFKAMVEMIHSTMKGENLLAKGTSAIFKAGKEVIPEHMVPGGKDRDRLDKQLKALREHPDWLINVADDLGHYMTEHATAVGQTTSNAVNYLNTLRPTSTRMSPLDKDLPPNPVALAAYNRALDIAQQPLIVLKNIKDGSLTSADVKSIQVMYPELYNRMATKIGQQIADVVTKGQDIPYRTRMGLSIFLQQPLDSTMRPSAIIAAQPLPTQAPQQEQGQKPPSESSMRGVSKLPASYLTPSQARAQRNQRD